MSPTGKMSLRLAIYSLAIGYIVSDITWFHGPLWKRIHQSTGTFDKEIVARVFGYQISSSQLERATREMLWRGGKDYDSLPPAERKLVRFAALDGLIDHELLRVKAMANASTLIISPQEIDARFDTMAKRFPSRNAMILSMKSQGYSDEQALRDHIAAEIQQEKYVESKIAPLCEVTDQEAREWFDSHPDNFSLPAIRRARHIFMATLDHPNDAAKPVLEATLQRILSGQTTFANEARATSEDAATKDLGGDLGWMDRSRVPAGIADTLFTLPLHSPTLVKSSLGWHILEVSAERPPRQRTFDEARTDIQRALTTAKREQAIKDFRASLRKFESSKIEIFHDRMDEW